jgi:DNA polymerase III alpha subunit
MKERDRLLKLCVNALESKGLVKDARYRDRLKTEIKAIDEQVEHEYLLNLHDKFSSQGLFFPKNENNLLVSYLLGLTQDFDIEAKPVYIQGEFPDIDIDYLKDIRDYLKRTWAPKQWGQEFICEIGTYGTSGIKSSILDMARVHNVEKDEIQRITVKMEDKDDEGKLLEWDKALEMYPDFKAYCENHPQVSEAAHLLLDRNRTGGVHAGGLIISSVPIDGFVPLEVRSVNKTNPNGVICSAWTEGLNAQDLQPVGLIKFDLLVINNLMQIAQACKLVKDRHGLTSICALPGLWDWSDLSYLNDPKALEMANNGDLKCIFQFDGDGIRKMVKRGGVTVFDDEAAYSALYRPGPLNMGMDARYCKRKRWEQDKNHPDGEPYNIHPLMKPILGRTYGVLVYQEQVMDILRVVGLIPDMHTEKVRKAISKKKVKDFIKYKEQFIENGQKVLEVNRDFVEDLWNQIESFAEYGFNKSHAYAYTYISARLLWLKAHYPLEFYSAILMCEDDHEKFKQVRIDAKAHGVEIVGVQINRSKENFHIEDGKIYFGFSNIKGIGSEVAKRIVEGQPYKSFADFLNRFGTDASVVKALVALGVFEEPYDRVMLRKFSEFYKDKATKRRQRAQRFEVSLENKVDELKTLVLKFLAENDADYPDPQDHLEDPLFKEMSHFTPEADALWKKHFENNMVSVPFKYRGEERIKQVSAYKILQDLAKKYETTVSGFKGKEEDDESSPVAIDKFDSAKIVLDKDEESVLKSVRHLGEERTFPEAEKIYYGFEWVHQLETCSNYEGNTFDKYMEDAETNKTPSWMVEVRVEKVNPRTSKSGTKFFSVDIEDANGKVMVVNVWKDDMSRWKDEIKAGNLLKMRVRPPSGGFNTLTFESRSRQEKSKEWPDKANDYRVRLLIPPEPPKVVETIYDDFGLTELPGWEELS